MAMKYKPIGDKVLVERLEAQDKTKGGIVIPDSAKEKPREGRVASLGQGRRLDDGSMHGFQVKEGDRVIFASYAGTDIKIEGKDYLIMPEEDILAIVE